MNTPLADSNPLWDALVHHALVGNGQHPISKDLKKHLAELNILNDDDRHALLEGIGVVQLLEKGAQEWGINEEPQKEVPDFGEEKSCSAVSMQYLRAILDGHHAAAFTEFTQLLGQHQRSLPATALPKLLDQCVQNQELWKLIQPILGERGVWLLKQHPTWKALLPQEMKATSWLNAKEPERLKLFFSFRKQAPQVALKSLLKLWSKLDYKEKARFLIAFSHGLSLEDENFLENCLAEKRKEVRDPAAKLLATLPESKLVKRLFEAAKKCLVIKNKSLHIDLPEDLPLETKKDGISPTGSKRPGGLKLNWLYQLVGRIPIWYWEKEWNIEATMVVRLFGQSGYPILVNGMTESLLRFPHQEGIDAQIQMWVNSENNLFWKDQASATELLENASIELFNKSLVKWLAQYGPFLPRESLATHWLSKSKLAWEPQLTKIVLLGFQDIIQNRSSPDWNLYHYKSIIHTAAYHSDVVLLEEFKKRWYMQSSSFGRWSSDLEKFLQTMSFRKQMQESLV